MGVGAGVCGGGVEYVRPENHFFVVVPISWFWKVSFPPDNLSTKNVSFFAPCGLYDTRIAPNARRCTSRMKNVLLTK